MGNCCSSNAEEAVIKNAVPALHPSPLPAVRKIHKGEKTAKHRKCTLNDAAQRHGEAAEDLVHSVLGEDLVEGPVEDPFERISQGAELIEVIFTIRQVELHVRDYIHRHVAALLPLVALASVLQSWQSSARLTRENMVRDLRSCGDIAGCVSCNPLCIYSTLNSCPVARLPPVGLVIPSEGIEACVGHARHTQLLRESALGAVVRGTQHPSLLLIVCGPGTGDRGGVQA